MDYGTSWSKLVLRDLEAKSGEPQAWVLSAPDALGEFRFPSLVVALKEKLYFGWQAERAKSERGAVIYPSIKMRLVDRVLRGFFGKPEPLPSGLDEEDLAVLSVLCLLQIGQSAARALARCVEADALLGMTLGVPMTQSSFRGVEETFTRVAARAFGLLKAGAAPDLCGQGLAIEDARSLVESSRSFLQATLEPAAWVRPEIGAALHWAVASPSIEDGQYAAIDIGAGTISTSVFRLVAKWDGRSRTWVKEKISVEGASCGPPAMDRIDVALAKELAREDWTLFRGEEPKYSDLIKTKAAFREILREIDEKRKKAFRSAYATFPRQSEWESERFKGVLVFGGGSHVAALRRLVLGHVWKWSPDGFRELVPQWPTDLRAAGAALGPKGGSCLELSRDLAVAYGLAFLRGVLVAYGLSFPRSGGFPTEDPGAIGFVDVRSLFKHRAWRDHEDLHAR